MHHCESEGNSGHLAHLQIRRLIQAHIRSRAILHLLSIEQHHESNHNWHECDNFLHGKRLLTFLPYEESQHYPAEGYAEQDYRAGEVNGDQVVQEVAPLYELVLNLSCIIIPVGLVIKIERVFLDCLRMVSQHSRYQFGLRVFLHTLDFCIKYQNKCVDSAIRFIR